MATFEITDPRTGKTLTVEGTAPPTPEDIDAIFSNYAPPPALAVPERQRPSAGAIVNEVIAGGARSVAGMADIATSPFQAFMAAIGKPVPSFESMVTPKGAFAGQGPATETASALGSLTTGGVTSGAIARSAVTSILDDAARYGESAFRGVLRQLGSSTAADDAMAAASSVLGASMGGQAGQVLGGAEGRQVGEFAGSFASPALLIPAIKRMTRLVEPMVRESAPSVDELRGASRALYKQIEDMGIIFSEDASGRIAKELQGIAVKEGLTDLRGESSLAAQYKKVMNILGKEGEYTGTSYSVMDKIRSTLDDIGKGTDNEARIARDMAKAVDNWLYSASPQDLKAATPLIGEGFTQEARQAVGPTLMTARALWRRASAGKLVEQAIKDAQIASEGRGAQEYETAVLNNFRNLLRREDADTKFTDAEKKLIAEAIKGGGVRRALETMSKFGIKSTDYVKTLISGTLGGAVALGGVSPQTATFLGATLGGVAVGSTAGAIASRMLRTDANTLSAFVRAGPNATALTKLYMQKRPAGERSAVELSALFKASGADLSALEKLPISKSPLVSDAVALTAAWQQLEKEEAAMQPRPQ